MDKKKLVFLKNRMERVMMDGNGAVAWEKYLRDKIVELLEILTEEKEKPITMTKAFSPELEAVIKANLYFMGRKETIKLKGPKPEDTNYLWRDYFITLIEEGLKGLQEHNL